MIALKTQTSRYWQQEFVVEDDDLEQLHQLIVEMGEPVSIESMVLELIKSRSQKEIDSLRSELNKGPMYQPKDRYEVGQTIVFPAFNFAAGKVVDTRSGYDPARGEFTVIGVQFQNSGERREFASGLHSEHMLNRKNGDDGLAFLKEMILPEELVKEQGSIVLTRLGEQLLDPAQTDFVRYEGRWLAREMMAEIHVGHLNIAEAAIDVAGAPLTTQQLAKDLDLPPEIPLSIQHFSLNAALSADERFMDAGWDGYEAWFLRHMCPDDALTPPSRLIWIVELFQRGEIHPDLIEMEKEIDDEAIVEAGEERADTTIYSARITLTYPHLRSGTLPLSRQVRSLFPKGSHQHTWVELVDGQKGDAMVGWINHEHGYIAGLSKWYEVHRIPAGAYLRLERTKKAGVIMIDIEPRRMRREWVRVASIEDDRIAFGLQKRPLSCEYDELMVMDHVHPERIDEFAEKVQDDKIPLSRIVRNVVPELVKLNPAGTVHAKTVYSAVNMVRRCPPGPVFAILSRDPAFALEGDGLISYDVSAEQTSS